MFKGSVSLDKLDSRMRLFTCLVRGIAGLQRVLSFMVAVLSFRSHLLRVLSVCFLSPRPVLRICALVFRSVSV